MIRAIFRLMHRISLPLIICAVSLLTACIAAPSQDATKNSVLPAVTPTQGAPMNVKIDSISYTKTFYKPGEPVQATVNLSVESSNGNSRLPAVLMANFISVTSPVGEVRQELTLKSGVQSVQVTWQPPIEAPRGYGLSVRVEVNGQVLASASSAFDMLKHWTQVPRYGFMSDYIPGLEDAAQTMATASTYYVNALQFYDWMYRHDQFLTDQEPYMDLFGRNLSRKKVDQMIEAAHRYGISAMPYSAVYASSLDFYNEHPQWAMFNPDGTAHVFIEGKMVYMDPRAGSPWVQHLLSQFDDVLKRTAFDGIHLDQYGDPKIAYDSQGNPYDVAPALVGIINATRGLVDQDRPGGGAVVFNAVTAWPIEQVAPSRQDISYIEVWPPYTQFTDLHQLITQAQGLGNNKPVVLAAYIDPVMQSNARLMDAIIYASGGGHIEMGEKDGYLADPYFPKYKTLTPELSAILKRYIQFTIRYEDVFGPAGRELTKDWQNRISVGGMKYSASMLYNKVYPLVRENDHYTAVNLVNLLGLSHGEWAKAAETPAGLGETSIEINDVTRQVKQVWFGSPDELEIGAQPVPWVQQGSTLQVTIPGFSYWGMVLIEWKD